MDENVMEGFLCPICIVDLKSPTELSAHFEEAHSEDKIVYQQLKSVFGKAKRKLLKENDIDNNNICTYVDPGGSKTLLSNGKPCTGGIDLALWETQTVGRNLLSSVLINQVCHIIP